MADTSDPACSCSVHLAPFGALHEPRRRHAPPAPMAACRLGPPQSPPISQAIGHKARNTPPCTNTLQPITTAIPLLHARVPTPAPPPPSVPANKVKVCTLAAKRSCVQRFLSTLIVHVPLSAAVNDASCVRWEALGGRPCHASLDLLPGHTHHLSPTVYRHTHADMSLYAGGLVKQNSKSQRPGS